MRAGQAFSIPPAPSVVGIEGEPCGVRSGWRVCHYCPPGDNLWPETEFYGKLRQCKACYTERREQREGGPRRRVHRARADAARAA